MTAHDHRSYVDGCYRCELSRDEVEPMSSDRTPADVIAPIFHYDETGNRARYLPLPIGAHNDKHAPGWVWVSDGYYGTPADCAGSWVKVTCTGTGRYGFDPLYEPVDQVPFSPWALSHGWLIWWVPGDVEPTEPPPVRKGFDPKGWCRWVAEQAAERAGFRVTPIPDDNTRAERDVLLDVAHAAWELIECSSNPRGHGEHLHLEVDHDRLRDAIDQLLATGWEPHEMWSLDGQPQDRPAQCPTCGSKHPDVYPPMFRHPPCAHSWHVGGSGDTR